MSERDRHEEELARILEAISDSYLNASLQELRDELEQEGREPEQVAKETRSVIAEAVRKHGRQRLEEARRRHDRKAAKLKTHDYDLPDEPEERRWLLMAIIAKQPSLREPLTLQHRDLTELDDADIESGLRQLAELGVLQEFERPGEE